MSIGSIKEFNLQDGNWNFYTERLEMYFAANSVKNDKKLPTLISVMGEDAYGLLASLASPIQPKDLSYDRAVNILSQHLQPKPSIMAERYKFRQRRQMTTETVACYVAELKRLSKYCDFGKSLEENLRDQFVCGVSSDVIRQRLFAEETLTYETAVRLAKSMESAERDAASVERTGIVHTQAGNITPELNKLNIRGKRNGEAGRQEAACSTRAEGNMQFQADSPNGLPCTVCGWRNHTAVKCKYRQHTCSKCKNVGHLRRMCPLADISCRRDPLSTNSHRKTRGVNFVGSNDVDDTDYSSCDDDFINYLSLSKYPPVSLPLIVNDKVISMEVDTGAPIACISKETYDAMFADVPLKPYSQGFNCYNKTKIQPVGVLKPNVKYGGISKNLELFVMDKGTTSLLGRHWLTELKIPTMCKHASCVNNIATDVSLNVDVLLDRYKEIFDGGLGRFNGGEIQLRLRDGAVPIYCRARPLPYALLRRVDNELDSMLRDGIIEPVDSSDWATPLVPVSKSDGGLRLCADYKITLNPVLLVDRYPLPRVEDLLVTLNGSQYFSKIDLSQAYNQLVLDETSRDLTVINTHRGLFRYNRLVFGLASSAGIFQRTMTNLLKGVHPSVGIFQDDVIIGGSSKEEHLKA
ncbi:uncharacterized protein K02A2.6-like [Leguminivora glycinivorella]|uniref:uncharacterized protein K02A2.6-like n=1 Tax=Leguminivora glycinivorella TaxID=1035111 RepID=UPI00200E561B|nr:uncharacterized protein K02A2.6-like [Leguminivora glycinivorella]